MQGSRFVRIGFLASLCFLLNGSMTEDFMDVIPTEKWNEWFFFDGKWR